MGRSMTSLPRILAEELDADWAKCMSCPRRRSIPSTPILRSAAVRPEAVRYDFGRCAYSAHKSAACCSTMRRAMGVPVAELTTEPSVVIHAKSGRRLSYGEIAAFAQIPAKAPDIKPEELKKTSEFRYSGKDTLRVELANKVNGSAKYAIDVQVPGMIYATVLRAPVEGAAPERVNDAKAKSIAGVIRIVRLPYGVGVLAETMGRVGHVRRLVTSRTKTQKRLGLRQGHGGIRRAARDLKSPASVWDKQGDAPRVSKAATIIEAAYVSDYAYHAQMEPLNAIASVSPRATRRDRCARRASPWRRRPWPKCSVSRATGVLHDTLMGGGFGRRGHRDEEFIVDAVLMAKEAKRPVKVIWTREDDVHNGRMRPLSAHYLRAGLDASGKLVAWHQRIAVDRVLPFADPVRYANASATALSCAASSLLATTSPSTERAALSRHGGAHLAFARRRLDRQHLRGRSLSRRDCREAQSRSGCVPARASQEFAARAQSRGDGRRDGELG
jgi:isoquinoline 1-oxidoreductase beta subunit